MNLRDTSNRRGFLGGLLATAGAVGLSATDLGAARPATQADPDAWMSEVTGDHRCFFDFNAHKMGVPLLHILNYLSTYQAAYSAAGGTVGAVASLYGVGAASSISMGFDDFIWEKYQLGEYTGLSDANGRPYTRNVFARPTEADGHLFEQAIGAPSMPMLGGAIADSGIATLQERGTKFIMCNNALSGWTFELEARGKGSQPEIDAELRAHLLPGVTIVPAMVIAIEQAQTAGIKYNKQ